MPMTEDMADFFNVDEFGTRLRWTKPNATTADFVGILDFAVEFFGPESDVPVLGKAVIVPSSAIAGHAHGNRLQVLNAAGSPTGEEYKLQRTLRDDGTVKTIEITK